MIERTPQQLDPLGGITARFIVIIAGVFAVTVAVLMSLFTTEQTAYPALEVAAILVLMITVGYFMRKTSPYRAPFTRGSLAIVFTGSLLAVVLNSASQWGANTMVRDDWSPIAIAIVIVSLGSYRTSSEILVGTVVSAIVVAVIAALESGSLTTPVPVGVYSIVAASPVLASGIASAAFSRTLVDFLTDWRAGLAPLAAEPRADDAPPATSHRGYLHGEVIPFLESVAATGSVSTDDGARARVLSQELRVLMVLDAEQSWAAGIVDDLDDPDGLARLFDPGQRACLRALVASVRNTDIFVAGTVHLEIERDGRAVSGELRVDHVPGSNPRVRLAPFVAVARSAFAEAEGTFTPTSFCLRFAFTPVT